MKMKITKLFILAIMMIVGITAKAGGFSAYCGYLMGTTDAQKALLTIETNVSGNIVMTIAPYNGDNNTAFRGSGYSDDRVKAFTVNGDPNANYKYFTRSINAGLTQITFTPVAGMMHDGDIVVFNQIIEYKTSKDPNLWPTFTFTYTYGATCAGLPKVIPNLESINFTPTQGVKTFTLTGENLTGNLTLSASNGLSVNPTTITPESNGTIASANQTVTVTWGSGRTSGGSINISGGGLVSPKIVTVTSSGFSEFCNTIISQENDGTSKMAYLTVTTSSDKTQVILGIDPYDTNAGATAKWKALGTIKVNNVTKTPTLTYNNNTTKTVATLTFSPALVNGDVVTFGGALVWELTGTLWNNTNCYINAAKTYTVGLGCSVAQADNTAPVVVSTSKVSSTSYDAVISVNATDNIGVTNIHFVDATNGIDVTKVATSDNGTANYTISNLQGNTAYSLVVKALDLAGNETATGGAKTVSFTTLHTPQITATPNSLEFTPSTGSKTVTISGAYVTETIQLSAPSGYTVTPNVLTPTSGAIASTIVTVNWINGLGNKIVLSGGGLNHSVGLVDLTYSGRFSTYCSYVITQNGGAPLTTPALLNIGLSSDKTVLTYKIAPFDITGDATWNGNSLASSIIQLNGNAVAPTRTQVNSNTITMTFSNPLADGDVISYAAGTTLVWTTTGYTNYGNNGNCYIDNWSQTYTVGQNCNLNQIVTTSGNDNMSSHGLTSQELVNTDFVVSSGEFILDQNATVNSLVVNPGAKLTLNSGQTLTTGTLSLQSDANGTATFVDKNTVNPQTFTANVQQYLTQDRNWYISSPVVLADTTALGSATVAIRRYDEPSGKWVSPTTNKLSPLTGYISTATKATGTVLFSGTLNTGAISTDVNGTPPTPTLTRSAGNLTNPGFNLVGNPYPSYVDWSAATKTNLETTYWFRTKTAPDAQLKTSYVFDTYNASGGQHTNLGATTVSNLIPPMQAFWVRVALNQTSGTLAFTNLMRAHSDASGNTMKAPSGVKSEQKVLRLQVSNELNKDEALIYFDSNASNNFDAYDSHKMTNGNAIIPEIYTLAGKEQVVINGLNTISATEELPLGFTTGQAGSFTIKATEINNFDGDNQIILKDNLLKTQQELTPNSAYNFTSDVISNANRFSLIFKSGVNISGFNNPENDLNVTVYKNTNNQITVNCSTAFNSTSIADVYNALGVKLATKQLVETTTIIDRPIVSGVYLVTVTSAGKCVTKKVILN